MGVFLNRFIGQKKYIIICCLVILVLGCSFGFYQYHLSSQTVIDFFKGLYYLNTDNYQNNYQLYLIQNALYLMICTYLSTSYIGSIGILFLLFCKGIQIAFSLYFVFTTIPLSLLVVLFVIVETIIEIALCIFVSYMCMHISTYVALVTFYLEQNFNSKSMLNFQLNSLIGALILFTIALCFRIYFIALF
ncbi:MAG: hypothetical protein RR630_00525 [Coprobacillus sp.]